MPSPLVLINGNSQVNGVNVSASSTVSVSLASTSGVYSWQLVCFGTDDLNATSAVQTTLSLNQSTFVATYTQPSTSSSAVLWKSIVNNGVDVNGVKQPGYCATFGVFTTTPDGYRVFASGQTIEGDAIYGWTSQLNKIVRGL